MKILDLRNNLTSYYYQILIIKFYSNTLLLSKSLNLNYLGNINKILKNSKYKIILKIYLKDNKIIIRYNIITI